MTRPQVENQDNRIDPGSRVSYASMIVLDCGKRYVPESELTNGTFEVWMIRSRKFTNLSAFGRVT
jgi:hypothetical protein